MFLNLIGIVCVSLCSLLSLNDREINKTRISTDSYSNCESTYSKPSQYIANYEDLYYISSFSDYSTTAFLSALLAYEQSDGYTHFLNADGVIQTIYFYDEIYRVHLSEIDFSNIGQTELDEYELTYFSYWGTISNNAYTDRYTKFNFVNVNDSTDIWYFTVTYRTYNLSNASDPNTLVLEGDLTNTLIRFNYSDTLAPYFSLGLFAYRYGMSTRQLTLFFKFDTLNSVYNDGYNVGYNNGRNVGYQEGVQYTLDNYNYDETATTIFTGITSIALVPIDMFLRIFNFEILGINVAGLVTGILTMAVIIIVIRMITGNKND